MTKFEDYKIIRNLARKADGRIYLAELKATEALHVLHRIDYVSAEDKKQANDLVGILRRMDSPYTVHLVDYFQHNKDFYIAIEYYELGNAIRLIDELQRLPENERLMQVWEIAAHLTLGLGFLHGKNVVHGALNPLNIFIMRDGSIRLGKFGTQAGLPNKDAAPVINEIVYVPSDALKKNKLDSSSDIYSFGVLLYVLLTGSHPFIGTRDEDVLKSVNEFKIKTFPAFVSKEMKDLITSAMNPDSSKRPTIQQITQIDTMRMQLRIIEDRQKAGQVQTAPVEEKRSDESYSYQAEQEKDKIQAELARYQQLQNVQSVPTADHSVSAPVYDELSFPDQNYIGEDITIPIKTAFSSGIVKAQVKSKNGGAAGMGIMRAMHPVGPSCDPRNNENLNHMVYFRKEDKLVYYNGKSYRGNDSYYDDYISLEVDFDKGTLHFFKNGKQQPVFVFGIAEPIRFFATCTQKTDGFEFTLLKCLAESNVKPINKNK
ncbi:MAG: putative Serine/threonine-protein kinase Nek3, partial [Streblomastix strix]